MAFGATVGGVEELATMSESETPVPCVHRRYHVFEIITGDDWDHPVGLMCRDCPKTWRVLETVVP